MGPWVGQVKRGQSLCVDALKHVLDNFDDISSWYNGLITHVGEAKIKHCSAGSAVQAE